MGKVDAETTDTTERTGSTGATRPGRRQVAFVCGQWRVTYLCAGEPGRDTEIRSGLLVGPLVPDRSSTAVWVAVVPDDNRQRTMIRRDWITSIAPPGRQSSRAR